MPAVTMSEGGSWIVPHVGGKPFLRKPPLVQWCIAGSMKLFGRNTWAARLPSALSVLALAAVIILATRGWLISEQSLVAAIVMMTQVATIEKCRLAELEAIYVALSGIAIVLWMSWWSQGRSPWLVWTVPFIFNGLAVLAKAPLHLLFFYAIVIAAMLAARDARRLFSIQHLAGVALMLGIFALWAVPYWQQVDQKELLYTVQRQAADRFTGADAGTGMWLMNLPNGIANHLPWILFAPLLWRREAAAGQHERTAALLLGGRWALAACFIGALLIPGVLPRYVQPLAVPFAMLLAPVLWECPRRFRHWWRYSAFALTFLVFLGAVAAPFIVARANGAGADTLNPFVAGLAVLAVFAGALLLMNLRRLLHESLHLSLWMAFVAAMAMLLYAVSAVPWMRLKEDIRPFAEHVDARLPQGATLHAYELDDYAPLLATLFYMKSPVAYVTEPKKAPVGEQFYLVRGRNRGKFEKHFTVEEPLVEMEKDDGKQPSALLRATRK
jgi:4-amino-4-deoxy-L-arabinose transferase-like glycosyltransferase